MWKGLGLCLNNAVIVTFFYIGAVLMSIQFNSHDLLSRDGTSIISKTRAYKRHLTSLSVLCAEKFTVPSFNGKEIRAEAVKF